jgi:5-methylcytosine-specific restriction endonuclease McrA
MLWRGIRTARIIRNQCIYYAKLSWTFMARQYDGYLAPFALDHWMECGTTDHSVSDKGSDTQEHVLARFNFRFCPVAGMRVDGGKHHSARKIEPYAHNATLYVVRFGVLDQLLQH